MTRWSEGTLPGCWRGIRIRKERDMTDLNYTADTKGSFAMQRSVAGKLAAYPNM